MYKENTNRNSFTDKANFFSKKKNVTNDGIVDACTIIMKQPQMVLKGKNPMSTQTPNQALPQNQITNTTTQQKPQ